MHEVTSIRLLPRTLLWRTVLLIALLLIGAHLSWMQIFRITERDPRARQAAQQIVSVVNLTRAALITAQPSKRFELLTDLSQREGIQVYADDPSEEVGPPPDRPFFQLVETELRQTLGPETRVALSRGDVRGLWVSFRIDEEDYWVRMPRGRIERNDSIRWFGWTALVLVFALCGAFLIVSRINRPLQELTEAAGQMGRGNTPPPVSESGPAEIGTLARAFNQMAADLKRLDDERAVLLAGVSHDLRTPLARVRLGLEMLDDKGDATLKRDLVEDIGEIDGAIGQFLDFARLASPEQTVPETSLDELVDAVVARYRSSGADVSFERGRVPALTLQPVAMRRVLSNLIDNALRHGGAPIEVVTQCDGDHIHLDVMDRGPGIPPAETDRMLQPFTRMNAARTGAGGTGLGLAIVDRIVRQHGGRVELKPRDGGGLLARVALPVNVTFN
jgi:two-component system osmolarity sensor histidine kinase EnvZ